GGLTTLFATEAGPSSAWGAGIWHPGGGLVSDGSGQILFATGNGFSNAIQDPIPGNTPPAVLDESMVRLQVQGDGSLVAVDFFAPQNLQDLDANDTDFGSGNPVALPSQFFGTGEFPNLIAVGGKDGTVFILDRNNLGGFQQGPGNGDQLVSEVQAAGGLWS